MKNKNLIQILKTVLLHALFWFVVWWFFIYFFGFNSNNKKYISWFASLLIPITIFATYTTIYYLIPNYLLKKKYTLFTLYSIYILIVSAYIVSLAMFFGFVYMTELNFLDMPPLSKSMPFILLSVYVVVIMVSAFTLLNNSYKTLKTHKALENKLLQSELELKKGELKYLKMQIQPHFLFNTLNTLYGFALKKSDKTPDIILKLSNLLDYILYQIDKPFVAISDELNHIEDYISLEKLRFNQSVKVKLKFDIKNKDSKIAPMLLLPFVENSFKHGSLINGVLNIIIEASTQDQTLNFKISNTYLQDNNNNNGIGLENIKKRLELLYPNNYQLNIFQKNQLFIVDLKLRPMKIKCLIVDDEPMAREIIESYLAKIPQIELVKSCTDGVEAFKTINTTNIDLILLDINMPDISGLQLAKALSDKTKIIFTTAYREYALDGFDLQAVDYLLKPISFDRFLKAINKYFELNLTPVTSKNIIKNEPVADYIFVRSERKMVKVNFEAILYIESLSDYIKIHTKNAVLVTRETITNIEAKLPSSQFIRIHRSYLVALDQIKSYTNEFVEINKKSLPISRTYKTRVLNRLTL